MEHPIHNLMKISMENIKEMIDVDTIIGQPVETKGGTVIIPISKVKFGFAAGGTEQKMPGKSQEVHSPFGGGSGGSVAITPIAFLVVQDEGSNINVLHLETQTHIYEKLIDFLPNIMDKLKVVIPNKYQNMFEEEEEPMNFD